MRLSPPSLGSSVKIEAGTLAFGNDKNLWIRKKRNDKNTYWSSFAELNLELGIPRNEEGTYNYLEIQWEIPDFGIFYLTYINSGSFWFQCIANNNERLLYANVPLQRFDKQRNKDRIKALNRIILDLGGSLKNEYENDNDQFTSYLIIINQELNRFFNTITNNIDELQLRYKERNDYDFQAEVDFPLNKTFRPTTTDLNDLDIIEFEEDEESEQEPTPTPQPETPEAEKGLPSIDLETWFGKFKVGDKVKVRWDYSNDLGLEKTKGFSKVDYFSSENNYSVVNVIISSDSIRPENITGKLYELNTGQFWEGKDLELITEQEEPTPTPQPDEFKPKFQVGDKVKRVIGSSILTIKRITAFDDQRQEWDYDLLNEGGIEVGSNFESELELVSTEIPTTSECDVDVSLIDSQYVGQFYQQNKNRIEALNPNISCLFLEALLSLSNYEKCGDGVEIPMPQPKKEEKEDLLSQIRNL